MWVFFRERDRSDPRHDRYPDRNSEGRASSSHRRGKNERNEYDEELQRFRTERGKATSTFEQGSDRCFTPPYSGGPRRDRAVSHSRPTSRSPSPPNRVGRSPGGSSSRGGFDNKVFSDKDSVVSDGSRHGSPDRQWGHGRRYKPRTQAISPPGGDSRHSSPQNNDRDQGEQAGRKRAYRTLDTVAADETTPIGGGGDFRDERRTPRLIPTDPRPATLDSLEKKTQFKNMAVDSGLSEDIGSSNGSCGSSGTVPDVDSSAKLTPRAPLPPRRISTDSAVSRTSDCNKEERLNNVYT